MKIYEKQWKSMKMNGKYCKSASKVLQKCSKSIPKVSQKYPKSVSKVSQKCPKNWSKQWLIFSTDFRRLFDLQNGVKMPPKSLILSTFRENGDIDQTLAGVVETPH